MNLKYSVNRFLKRVPNKQEEKNKLLIIAAHYGHTKMVTTLLKGGAEVNEKSNLKYKKGSIDSYNNTPLYMAARNGHSETVEALLNNGANPKLLNCMQDTALEIAACKGYTNTVNSLVKGGADTEITGNGGYMPIHKATINGHIDTVETLLNASADINAITSNFEGTKFADVQFNKCDIQHETALHLATKKGDTKMINILLKRGARTDIENHNGKTALDIAIAKGDKKIIALINKYHKNCIPFSILSHTIKPNERKKVPKRETIKNSFNKKKQL